MHCTGNEATTQSFRPGTSSDDTIAELKVLWNNMGALLSSSATAAGIMGTRQWRLRHIPFHITVELLLGISRHQSSVINT